MTVLFFVSLLHWEAALTPREVASHISFMNHLRWKINSGQTDRKLLNSMILWVTLKWLMWIRKLTANRHLFLLLAYLVSVLHCQDSMTLLLLSSNELYLLLPFRDKLELYIAKLLDSFHSVYVPIHSRKWHESRDVSWGMSKPDLCKVSRSPWLVR